MTHEVRSAFCLGKFHEVEKVVENKTGLAIFCQAGYGSKKAKEFFTWCSALCLRLGS
jgi:hypothetical protein